MNMAGKKLTPDDLAMRRYLSHIVRTARTTSTWEALVARWGISKPQLYKIQDKAGGLGDRALKSFAKALFNGSRDDMDAAAREWADKHPDDDPTTIELDALNPKEAVRVSPLYQTAPPEVQRMFDSRDPYTPGDEEKDIAWYTERLLDWVKAGRNGLIPADPVPGATDVKPRKRKA